MATIKKTVKKFKTCQKCSGTGSIPCYTHVSGGRCFRCGGAGKLDAGYKTIEIPADHEKKGPSAAYLESEEFQKRCAEFDYSSLGEE